MKFILLLQNEVDAQTRHREQPLSLTDNSSDEEMEKDTFEDEGDLLYIYNVQRNRLYI